MNFDNITVAQVIIATIAMTKAFDWIYRRFITAYKIKHDIDCRALMLEEQQKEITQLNVMQEAIVSGMRELLKRELKDLHTELMKKASENGSITSEDFRNFESVYKAYTGLNGNGTGTRYHDDVSAIPIVDSE